MLCVLIIICYQPADNSFTNREKLGCSICDLGNMEMVIVQDLLNSTDGNIKTVLRAALKSVASEDDAVNLKQMKKDHLFGAVVVILRKILSSNAKEVEDFQDALDQDSPSQSQSQTQQGSGENHEKNESQSQTVTQDATLNDGKREAKPCYFFRAGRCKFGSSCRFYHGKICRKYRRHGRGENGCKLGKECPMIHVVLCPQSYKNKSCEKGDECPYKFHIKSPKHLETQKKMDEKAIRPNPFLGQPKMEDKIHLLEGQLGELNSLLRTFVTSMLPWRGQ